MNGSLSISLHINNNQTTTLVQTGPNDYLLTITIPSSNTILKREEIFLRPYTPGDEDERIGHEQLNLEELLEYFIELTHLIGEEDFWTVRHTTFDSWGDARV